MTPIVIAAALLGLLIGSFLTVVVERVPEGQSVVAGRSHCPKCGHQIGWYDNVPVISWLLLRGKCPSCGLPIHSRYPVIELATALGFAAMAWRFGLSWVLPAYLYFAAIAVALSVIDIRTRRLPNSITLPSYGVAIVLLGTAAIAVGERSDFLRALAGGALLLALYLIPVLAYPAGMGMGDVKLSGVLGLYLGWLGWGELALGAFLGFALGALYGVGLLALGRGGRKTALPFGPFMLAGAAIAILFGGTLVDAYLRLVGLS